MEAGEYGVVFVALPTWLGGGVSNTVIEPGEVKLLPPWSSIYRVSSTDRSIGWGGVGEGSAKLVEDYVETRALDGNEVGLAMTIQYAIEKSKAPQIIQKIGIEPGAVDQLVRAVAQADIRTHMNILKTADFFGPKERQDAVNDLKIALQRRLEPDGIIIRNVIYNAHRFERRLDNGTMDDSYQQQINGTQQILKETEQEQKKIATVVEQKRRERNETQGVVNRQLEQANGNADQAKFRGDSYLAAKNNEAEQIRTVGMAAVEGLEKQIEALKGPGGKALLKMEIVKNLLLSDPKFISMGSKSGNNSLQVDKTDTNELIQQLGIITATEPSKGDLKKK